MSIYLHLVHGQVNEGLYVVVSEYSSDGGGHLLGYVKWLSVKDESKCHDMTLSCTESRE